MHLCKGTELEEWTLDLARGFVAADGQPLGHSMLFCSLDDFLGPASDLALLESMQDVGILQYKLIRIS